MSRRRRLSTKVLLRRGLSGRGGRLPSMPCEMPYFAGKIAIAGWIAPIERLARVERFRQKSHAATLNSIAHRRGMLTNGSA